MRLWTTGFWTCGLAMLLFALPARADITYVLQNAVFADGTTATGYFSLDVYGYVETVDIVTTPGTAASSAAMPGETYTNPASAYFFGETPPVDDVSFSTGGYAIAMNVPNLLTNIDTGPDPLIPGSGSYPSLAGSYEECIQSSICGGPALGDARLLVSGDLVVPEPASVALLIAGVALLPAIRRRRL